MKQKVFAFMLGVLTVLGAEYAFIAGMRDQCAKSAGIYNCVAVFVVVPMPQARG